MLHTRVWKIYINFSLEKFIHQHRNTFFSMQSCDEYVKYQLPTEHTRVGYLLAGIQYNDAGLQDAMASVQIGMSLSGKRNCFESTSTHILPDDPVTKKRTSNKWGSSDIPKTSKVEVPRFGSKSGIGKRGVHLRYNKPS